MDKQPLLGGRLLRSLLGVALLCWLFLKPPHGFVLQGLLLFFGISLLIGGLKAYAGCEVLAIPNLLLNRRMHCY